MIKFLDGEQINAKIMDTIKEADEYLIFISPFIQLSDRIKTEISFVVGRRPSLMLEVIFGKNQENPSKSLSSNDLEFLKSLPNVRVGYVKELHAKIYCSEDRLMLSSMNLYGYSQKNNYEAAFVIEDGKSMFGSLLNNKVETAWQEALDFVDKIINKSTLVYENGKVYKSKWHGLSNELVEEYNNDNSEAFFKKPLAEPISQQVEIKSGFCIRTGNPIPFNIKKPLCDSAFKAWAIYKNENFKEKFCHYSGEASNGETSFRTPVLRKNYKAAISKLS